MEDITLRALRVLAEVDVICAEDTRRTRNLLDHHDILLRGRKMISCHEHNESSRVKQILDHLAHGRTVALVTDAGTPAISDPGYVLVRAARTNGYPVIPVPGANAAIAALSSSGLPTDRFTYAGFPPKKAGARQRFLDELATAAGTLVLYAAARDVPQVLEDLIETRANPEVAVYREITKTYEECLFGQADEVLAEWTENPRKGEVTLLAGRAPTREFDDATLLGMLRDESVKTVQDNTGVARRRLYQLSLLLKDES